MKTSTIRGILCLTLLWPSASAQAQVSAQFHGNIAHFKDQTSPDGVLRSIWSEELRYLSPEPRMVSASADVEIEGDFSKLTNEFLLNSHNVATLQSARWVRAIENTVKLDLGEGSFRASKDFFFFPDTTFQIDVSTFRQDRELTINLDLHDFESLFRHSYIRVKVQDLKGSKVRVLVFAIFTLRPRVIAPGGISQSQTVKQIKATIRALDRLI